MVYGRTPFSHLRDVGQKIMAIQNPRYVISYAPTTLPMNERGEELTNLAFSVPEELIETMRRCLVFDPKKRATIPELLEGDLLEWKREKVIVKSGESPLSRCSAVADEMS
jgi:serine/threonine-protein kinase TTK/MPS1